MGSLLIEEQDLQRLADLIDTQEQQIRMVGATHGRNDDVRAARSGRGCQRDYEAV
jgi:hypothetical protein